MPLTLEAYINLITSYYRLRLDVYTRIYQWLERTVIIKGLMHTAAAASLYTPNLYKRLDITALTVSFNYILKRNYKLTA
jgi:hypothetical protein